MKQCTRECVVVCVCIFVRFDETMNIGRTNNFCLYKHIRTMSQMRKRQKRKETIESIPHSRTFPNQSILTRFYSTMQTINFFNHVSWQFFAFVFSPYFNGRQKKMHCFPNRVTTTVYDNNLKRSVTSRLKLNGDHIHNFQYDICAIQKQMPKSIMIIANEMHYQSMIWRAFILRNAHE